MYTNHHSTEEYPFFATFYTLSIDESKPLDQRKEEKKVFFETLCDISDRNNSLSKDTMTLYFPFDSTTETLQISKGLVVEVETYGIIQKGRVLGIYPSQLGGVTVLCQLI